MIRAEVEFGSMNSQERKRYHKAKSQRPLTWTLSESEK